MSAYVDLGLFILNGSSEKHTVSEKRIYPRLDSLRSPGPKLLKIFSPKFFVFVLLKCLDS